MNNRVPNVQGHRGFVGGAIAVAAVSLACQRTLPEMTATSPAPVVAPSPRISAPSELTSPKPETELSRRITTGEEHITIDTHGAEIDVRQALSFIASRSGFNLVFSPEINRKVRLELNDVPVSEALQAVLAVAGLTLESTTPKAKVPGSSSVVFYELPVNVDSLSADAIMKRFGVGRAIAELLVQGRVNKP